jgi:hypothetical protein
MFLYCPPKEIYDLKTEIINNKRHYVTPNGKYASITTILGSFNKQRLFDWRKKVGEEEATRISTRASSRGTKTHSLCEQYLNNKAIDYSDFANTIALDCFISIKPFLDNINNIHYLECALYSDRLKVAGRCDAIAEYDGVLSIIDYKTSTRLKTEEDIQDYFLQATFYAMAYYELTGIKINQIIIIIAVEDDNPQIFIKDINSYIKILIGKVKCYHSRNS